MIKSLIKRMYNKSMLFALIFALVLNLVMFFIAFRNKTDKLTDISYALTFIGIVIYNTITATKLDSVRILVNSIIVIWAIRLGAYLLIRINFMGRDKRFDGMREYFWKFIRFWLLQAITVWVVMLPSVLLSSATGNTKISSMVILGLLISAFGILIEALADKQKFEFIKNPANKNKWIDSGLWAYSRHPNYFGEILMWLGVYLSVAHWIDSPEVYIALASPLFITSMLLFISGIPLLEKAADKKWGSDKNYLHYKKSTSVLIPLPKSK